MSLSTPAAGIGSASSCTVIRVERCTYDWDIKASQFLSCQYGRCIYSPIFRTIRNELEWRLCLYPTALGLQVSGSGSDAMLYLCLHSHKSGTIQIKVHAKLSILSVGFTNELHHTFEKKQDYFCGWIERSKLNSVPSGVITIRCEIEIPLETMTGPIDTTECMEQAFDCQEGQWVQDFRLLFTEAKFSDVVVIVGTHKFPAHKLILATRSPVFAAMFEHKETKENLTNEVKIENMEPQVVKAMLEFIYTDEVTKLEELAYGLLGAADKYDLQRLKSMCEKVLYRTLNKDNAAEILIHADLHRSRKLEEYVMRFMDDYLFDVVDTESYEEMRRNYPELLNKLVRTIAA